LGRNSKPAGGSSRRGGPKKNKRLTDREMAILRLLAKGLGNQDIARRLGVVELTIRKNRDALKEKLGLPHTADSEAILAEARRQKLIEEAS